MSVSLLAVAFEYSQDFGDTAEVRLRMCRESGLYAVDVLSSTGVIFHGNWQSSQEEAMRFVLRDLLKKREHDLASANKEREAAVCLHESKKREHERLKGIIA